ncbi:MAG: ATP-binding protein [Lachnospiraceae bacterium]
MIRQIIHIDEEKCIGCGLCADACHEGAIAMVNGKAKLMREDYCDGLGDCLPACPADAISFVTREAPAYDAAAVEAAKLEKAAKTTNVKTPAAATSSIISGLKLTDAPVHTGCPGSRAQSFTQQAPAHACPSSASRDLDAVGSSALSQCPIQIKLVPVNAPYFNDADLLIAADCTAYSYSRFHEDFIKGRITLIGCPKLDDGDYSEKLTEIFTSNKIKSIHLVRMMVPCCGGLSKAVANAIAASGKQIPCTITTISPQGEIIRTERI